jgi:hypothetical protein
LAVSGQEVIMTLNESEQEFWQDVVDAYLKYVEKSGEFFQAKLDRIKLLREGLRRGNTAAVLDLTSGLDVSETIQLLPELIYLSTAPGYARKAREIILSMPYKWLLLNVEKAAEPIMSSNDEEDFRRLFELYLEINRELAEKFTERVLDHSDEYIREIGQDFLEILSSN